MDTRPGDTTICRITTYTDGRRPSILEYGPFATRALAEKEAAILWEEDEGLDNAERVRITYHVVTDNRRPPFRGDGSDTNSGSLRL